MVRIFNITKRDLKAAADRSIAYDYHVSSECVVARVVRRAFPNAWIGFGCATLRQDGRSAPLATFSSEVSRYILQFDKADYKGKLELPEFQFSIFITELTNS